MCLLVLFVLAALACWARFKHHKRAAWFLVFSLTLMSLLLGIGSVSQVFLDSVQSTAIPPDNVPWKEKNAIIVLGAGTDRKGELKDVHTVPIGYSRIVEGARRYFECAREKKICRLILSGGDPSHHDISEAEVMGKELEQMGVPKSALTLESKSNNTFQNAEFTSQLLTRNPVDQTLIVTSGFHVRRALLYFSHFHVDALGIPSDHWRSAKGFVPFALNMAMIDLSLHEQLGILLFHVYNFMGWNR